MRMRHIRLLAATGTVVSALALSACGGNGTGTKDEGRASQSVSPTAAATADRTPSAAPGTAAGKGTASGNSASGTSATRAHTPGTRQGGGRQSGGKPDGTGGSIVLCNGANTTVTARPVPRPLNHMLITVKNTGRRICELPYSPVIRFDEMQWAPQAAQDTQPQAVVSLAPGESGYAGVRLSAADGSGEGGTTAHKLTVMFQGRTPNSDGGPAATPTLPAKGVYYDSSLTVSYWQQKADDALNW
ncbi:DUF4232 domain-containing protein [Streptomyces alanosinicus]|uniref:DUF4232 domain-containing protein n=1 Tax=Streptomyces alanosinicus TaxID=68171 RepID=A0A919D8P7_9ACTN|nr:DUF4232 domain-containing protein [Streptomyces alanosinicus]GHE15772.1 hypothetical protein GCM10010339_91500 [Streptomyces alanosinicus]